MTRPNFARGLIVKLFNELKNSLLHVAFPSSCIACKAMLPPGPLVLCDMCSYSLELISLDERCPTCLSPLPEILSHPCQECILYTSPIYAMGAAFDYKPPASSLVKALKYGNCPFLAKGMAAFLLAQFERLQWPMPDALIPVPLSLTRWLERGYNQSALLAEELGSYLKRPVWKVLKRKSGDFSQAAQSLEQRKSLDGKSFHLNPSFSLQGKILLLIDDVMTTGTTLKRCAELIAKEEPAALYALTFCHTMELNPFFSSEEHKHTACK